MRSSETANSLRDALIAGLIVLACIPLIELGLRVAGVKFTASLYRSERDRGYALRPGSEGWDVEESESYVRINIDGMRDREHAISAPPGALRIAVLGDSEVEARQVPLDKTFASRIETRLNQCLAASGEKAEVLNFAAPGYSLAQDLITLETRVRKYHPRIVIVASSIDSIILKSTRELYGGDTHGAPFFTIANGELQLDPATVRERAAFQDAAAHDRYADLMNRSRLLSLLNASRIEASKQVHDWLAPGKAHAAASRLPADYMATWPYLGPANPELARAWETGEALIRAIRDEAERQGAEFWLVTLDMTVQTSPNLLDRAAMQKRLGTDSLFVSDRLLDQFARREGIHHVTLAPEIAQYTAATHISVHGFPGGPANAGHWNEAGHEIAGKIIARELCSEMHTRPAL